MAVEVEAAGQVDEFLRILRKRIWWIVVPTVVIGSLGCFFAVVVPKKYVSRTEILVRDGNATTELARAIGEGENEGRLAPFTIRAPARIKQVLEKLNWSDYKTIAASSTQEADEYVLDRLADLRVVLPTMAKGVHQQQVQISYRDNDGDRAHQFLLRLFESWKEEVLRSKVNAAEKEYAEVTDELQNQEDALERVTEAIRGLQVENDIPPPRQGFARNEPEAPPVFARKAALEDRLSALEEERELLATEIEALELKRDEMPRNLPREGQVVSDPTQREIEKIDTQIANLNFTIEENGWSPAHSGASAIRDRIAVLQQKKQELLVEQSRSGTDEFGGTDEVPNEERLALDALLRDKSIRMGQLVDGIRQKTLDLRELEARVESTHAAMASIARLESERVAIHEAMTRLNLRKADASVARAVLAGPQGNPFTVQQAPTIPTEATSPNPWIIAFGSIVFGFGLGLGLALLKEYTKNCFRSARDLSRVMTHPVLGKVNTIRTRRERARSLLVQSVLGGGSLLFALSMAYVTWAWAKNQDGLTDSLVNAINSFQQALK